MAQPFFNLPRSSLNPVVPTGSRSPRVGAARRSARRGKGPQDLFLVLLTPSSAPVRAELKSAGRHASHLPQTEVSLFLWLVFGWGIEYNVRWIVKNSVQKDKRFSMTQYERMTAGLIYDPADEEIMKEQSALQQGLWDFNQLQPSQNEEKTRYMKEVFAECGEDCYIELPFRANWGGKHVHFGSRVYANFNLTLVDDGHIYVGDAVMFGPNVTIATANHPVQPELRARALQYNKDVHIGNNVWIGAGTIIVPGVTIGDNSVIGGGSVVVKDIPANVVAAGNPCRVLREIGPHDDEFFYKDEKIDWPL